MSQVGGGLSWLMAHHLKLGVDEAESVNHHLAFHGLYWVDNYGNGSRRKLFEGLLCIDIDR